MAAGRLALALGLAALAFPPAPARAQAQKPAAPAAAPTQAQMERAASNFRVMVGALQSDKIPQPVKNILFMCAYSNTFRQISESTDKLMADRKVDRSSPDNVVSAMAAICGLRPEMLKQPPQK